MTYTVKFRDDALKEWLRLDKTIQQQFAKKLKKCSENPHIASAKLRGLKDCYKIKLRPDVPRSGCGVMLGECSRARDRYGAG